MAATDGNDEKAGFSNFGKDTDLFVPSVEIYSPYGNGLFSWWSGTSQAAPIVAGEAALLRRLLPSEKAKARIKVMTKTTTDISDLNPDYKRNELGDGRVDLLAAVTSAIATRRGPKDGKDDDGVLRDR